MSDFILTLDHLKTIKIGPKNVDEWYEALNTHLPEYEINTVNRVACFLAQCMHESGSFNFLIENLNYSKEALRRVFPKYFPTDAMASMYARKPEDIANIVYANRMDNGSTESGDGWKFRGRGVIQLTGRSNYTACSQDLFGDDTLVQDPDKLTEPYYAILSACWFWSKNGLNRFADSLDVITLTKRINGGTNGLSDRLNHTNKIRSILNT
jgi:putative chitinase